MTEKQWIDYYRKKYPSRSEAEIKKLAKAQVEKQSQTAGSETGITFGGDNATSTTSSRGVRIGFGLTDANGDALIISPGKLPAYMQTLLLKNPKKYAKVQTLVYQASGRKYSDPDALGTWLETIASNLQVGSRQDPTLANTTVESIVNAAVVNRASNPLFAKTTAGAENLPTRQIYAKTDAEIESDINAQAEKVLGRAITPEDMKQGWYKDLRKGISGLYGQGIVTKTEKVKNPVTGKMENVVTQVPQFSQEQITGKITSALEEADPVSVERKKNLEFANWAFQKMGGRG